MTEEEVDFTARKMLAIYEKVQELYGEYFTQSVESLGEEIKRLATKYKKRNDEIVEILVMDLSDKGVHNQAALWIAALVHLMKEGEVKVEVKKENTE